MACRLSSSESCFQVSFSSLVLLLLPGLNVNLPAGSEEILCPASDAQTVNAVLIFFIGNKSPLLEITEAFEALGLSAFVLEL